MIRPSSSTWFSSRNKALSWARPHLWGGSRGGRIGKDDWSTGSKSHSQKGVTSVPTEGLKGVISSDLIGLGADFGGDGIWEGDSGEWGSSGGDLGGLIGSDGDLDRGVEKGGNIL